MSVGYQKNDNIKYFSPKSAEGKKLSVLDKTNKQKSSPPLSKKDVEKFPNGSHDNQSPMLPLDEFKEDILDSSEGKPSAEHSSEENISIPNADIIHKFEEEKEKKFYNTIKKKYPPQKSKQPENKNAYNNICNNIKHHKSIQINKKKSKNEQNTESTNEQSKNEQSTESTNEQSKNEQSTESTDEQSKNEQSTESTNEQSKNEQSTESTNEQSKNEQSTESTNEVQPDALFPFHHYHYPRKKYNPINTVDKNGSKIKIINYNKLLHSIHMDWFQKIYTKRDFEDDIQRNPQKYFNKAKHIDKYIEKFNKMSPIQQRHQDFRISLIKSGIMVLIVFLIIRIGIGIYNPQKRTYNAAIQSYYAGNYSVALEHFEKTRYQNSSIYATYCRAAIARSQGHYDEAKKLFLTLTDYDGLFKEAASQSANNCDYLKAKALETKGSYQKALTILKGIKNYTPAITEIKNCTYHMAVTNEQNKALKSAIQEYASILDYKDAEKHYNYLADTYYQSGMQLYSKKQFDAAQKKFKISSGYKNSNDMVIQCEYEQGLLKYKAKNFTDALIYLNRTINYKDSSALVKECIYQIALTQSDYKKMKSFEQITPYKDTEKFLSEPRLNFFGKWVIVDSTNKSAIHHFLTFTEDNILVSDITLPTISQSTYTYDMKAKQWKDNNGYSITCDITDKNHCSIICIHNNQTISYTLERQ